MKKIVSTVLISSMMLSSVSFAAKSTPNTTTAKPAITEESKALANFKIGTPKNANNEFSQTSLHTAKNISPYTFDIKLEDFATQKWTKYVSAVYVQSTDINYYVSMIYADGTIKQVIALNVNEVEQIIEKTKAANDALRKEALAKPEKVYTSNYRSIYQASWQLVDEKTLITAQQMNAKNLASVSAELPGTLINEYKVYKKGEQLILLISVFPTGTRSCTVSSNPADIDAILGKIIEKNNKLISSIK